jgi:hypothetical protein
MQIPGLSLRRIPAGRAAANVPVFRLDYHADPSMVGERLEKLRSAYTSDARWRREMEIEYSALEGELLYPEWNRGLNVCEPFDVSDPEYWTIYHACDPHGRTPHAFLWEAFNKHGDQVVCGDLWSGRDFPGERFTVAQYALVLKWLESDSKQKPEQFSWANGKALTIYDRVMDTHGLAVNSDQGKDFFESYRDHDLYYRPALKGEVRLAVARDEIGAGLLAKEFKLGSDGHKHSKLTVFAGCIETISEFERVRYPEGEPERPAHERPMTYRKHCLDCLHYIQTKRPEFVDQRPRKSTFRPLYPAVGY